MDIFTLICYKILYDLIEKTENKLKTMFTNLEIRIKNNGNKYLARLKRII